ncbi:multiple C2 and transmembrane domain-containing protein 1 isoform X2 [Salminus brasiliensis]|uniref:multiple C2 and transmembrane domain-containing protein 1 isoform X2 n=1 Tax=Salminus brasiliensis TaxID=930266 RepID=UPI003B837875
MEEKRDHAGSPFLQRTLWRSSQAKPKLSLSPKPSKKELKDGLMKLLKKRKQTDGVRPISSSEPDLRATRPNEELAEESSSSGQLQTWPEPNGSPLLDFTILPGVSRLEDVQEQLAENSENIKASGHDNTQLVLPRSGMYKLDILLKRGHNLAIRDRGGSSDPYVKFKLGKKEVFRSKIIHKNLNPEWDESFCLPVENLNEPLYIKVFDYDFGCHDDFMGSAYLYLDSLEHQRIHDVKLHLQDSQSPLEDLGSLELVVTLTPKDGENAEVTMLLTRRWKRASKQQQQNQRLSEVHKKSQLWRSTVKISLIEGRDLMSMDQNGLSDPYVKFRLANEKYKSKTMPKTLNPQWREQFDLHVFNEDGGILEMSVWDKDTGRRDDFMGQCTLDLSTLSREQTHKLVLDLEDGKGQLVLLVTLTASSAVSISELSVNLLDDPNERQKIMNRYSLERSFCNLSDIGIVQIKILRAEGLMAADVTGKSDPFCVVELCNDRLQTHTVYKNLNPEWNKVFTLNVKDIHSVLEVSVYDEDRDRSADFLGKVAIPLLSIHNGEQKAYVLKNKELTGPTKGVIFLEADIIFNIVKASLRTFVPAEQKYIEEESKVSKRLLLQNFNRVKRCIMFLINAGSYINSCFEWESTKRSICAFLVFVLVVWNLELYMVPLSLLLFLSWNYFLLASGKETREGTVQAMEDLLEKEDEEDEKVSINLPRNFVTRTLLTTMN